MKTKLGISTAALGALAYFMALFGGYIPLLLLTGYVCLFEDNEALKKHAFKALAISVCIDLAIVVVGVIPDFIGWINSMLAIFDGGFSAGVLYDIENFLTSGLWLIEKIVLGVLGILTYLNLNKTKA